MSADRQYPRLMSSAVAVGAFGDERAPLYKGVLWRIDTFSKYIRLGECEHQHRNRSKALECADRLAELDGAPR